MAARLVKLEGHGIALPDRHGRRHRDPCTKAPQDVAILVRMRANNVEGDLAPVLRDNGLTLGNLGRNVGEIAIQDVLAEPLTEVLLPLLRLVLRVSSLTGRDR